VAEEPAVTAAFTLIHLAETDSTQSFLARHPEMERCAVLADAQTAGRGRGGNAWESAPGAGLWLSARMPAPALGPGPVLQKAMGAVIDALAPYGVELGLKWPNDLVGRREGRLVKVGGIIGEISKGRLILGVGVNLKAAPEIPDRPIPPACLVELGATPIPDARMLALAILARWEDLAKAAEPSFRWPQEGDAIRWEEGQGICEGWAEDGRLKVRTDQGAELLSVGDVNALSPEGGSRQESVPRP